jgi:hypothetical protein
MISVEQVPLWAVDGRIGHAVASRNQGWTVTACELWSPSFLLTEAQPTSICSACLKRLKSARPVQQSN